MQKVAIFGTSANPPGLHHEDLLRKLVDHFDRIIIFPCGPRNDGKLTTNDIAPLHRAALTDLAFAGIPKVEIDLSDLERDVFTRTCDIDTRFRSSEVEVTHVVGSDLIQGGTNEKSKIHNWKNGRQIWNDLNFVVFDRSGYPTTAADLPRHSLVFRQANEGSSTDIRDLVFKHKPIDGLVRPAVANYIERHGLYRGAAVMKTAKFCLGKDEPRLLVVADRFNEAAMQYAESLSAFVCPENANMILVLGGDGTMLRAVRENWRRRLPFVGINFGTRGFLLNNVRDRPFADVLKSEMRLLQSPLLFVELEHSDGKITNGLAFNDAFVQVPGDPVTHVPKSWGWIEVRVNDEVQISKLVAFGAIVSTAAGSGAYARHAGASPVPVGTDLLVLAGSLVDEPLVGWRPTYHELDTTFEFRDVDISSQPKRRLLLGIIDGVSYGEVVRMKVRTSRIAAVEIAELPGCSFKKKLSEMQYPSK